MGIIFNNASVPNSSIGRNTKPRSVDNAAAKPSGAGQVPVNAKSNLGNIPAEMRELRRWACQSADKVR